jgi:hypothetical protein
MRESLELVRGAVSDKDLIPVLTHFHIYDGKIQGGNGRVSIEAEMSTLRNKDPLTVPAGRFLRAVDAGAVKITVHDERLHMKGQGLKIVLPLADSSAYPVAKQPAKWKACKWDLLPVLQQLKPFIGSDASRIALCSIAIRDGYAYAANNPTVARVKCAAPNMVLPVYLIDELLRIGIEPVGYHGSDLLLTFRLTKTSWIQSVLLTGKWPDVEEFFKGWPKRVAIVPTGLREAIDAVLPFCQDDKFPALHFSKDGVSTTVAEVYAVFDDVKVPDGRWHARNIALVLKAATHINLNEWPKPCRWRGESIEGVTVGLQ